MSINPVLARDASAGNELFPLPYQGEFFVLKRTGIAFSAYNSSKKYSGKGKLFLTTMRIVFMKDGNTAKHTGFSTIELPLHALSGDKPDEPPEFKQPIFGANYFTGKVEPTVNAENPLPGTTTWRLTFNHGGCMTFLRAFFSLMKQARDRWSRPDPAFVNQVQAGANAAFYDPSDPSELYVTQPQPDAASLRPPSSAPAPGAPPPHGCFAPPAYPPPAGSAIPPGYPPPGYPSPAAGYLPSGCPLAGYPPSPGYPPAGFLPTAPLDAQHHPPGSSTPTPPQAQQQPQPPPAQPSQQQQRPQSPGQNQGVPQPWPLPPRREGRAYEPFNPPA